MIDFPASTAVHRKLPKEAFYKHLPLTAALKSKFVSDVESIFVENSLTSAALNFSVESEVKEILLLLVNLKKAEFDAKIIEAIARQNPHRLIFLLAYEDQRQLAVYHGKLYRTEWGAADGVDLTARGATLDEVWNSFIEQIALQEERVQLSSEKTVDERLFVQERILKLEKQIAKAEAAAWREQQPKKRFALYQKLQQYQAELEAVKRGKTD